MNFPLRIQKRHFRGIQPNARAIGPVLPFNNVHLCPPRRHHFAVVGAISFRLLAGPGKVEVRFSHDVLGTKTWSPGKCFVTAKVNAFLVLPEDGKRQGIEDARQHRLVILQGLLRPPLFGLVAEDQYRAGDLALFVANRRAAIGDGPFAAIAGQQQRVVGEVHDSPFTQHALDWVVDVGPRLFVDDVEDLRNGPAQRLRLAPPGELLGHGVHAG